MGRTDQRVAAALGESCFIDKSRIQSRSRMGGRSHFSGLKDC